MNQLELKFKQTLQKIKVNRRKKIIVALSGGKDSAVVAFLLKKFNYKIKGIYINLRIGNYSKDCLKKVKELCQLLKIKLHVYDIKKEMGSGMCYLREAIQSNYSTQKNRQLKNCAICGVIKKWVLNKIARNLKADYIATGHNLDDEVQTFLINILKGSLELSANSGIKTKNISDKKFVPRIKPLFYIAEKDIKNYSIKKKLPVNYSKCPCATDSYRIQIRNFLQKVPTKEKENIIKNSEKILGKTTDKTFLNYCEVCGEPCRGKICKKCQLMTSNE